MPHIVFVTHDGVEHEVEVTVGRSVMEIARQAGIAGIEGDCGGNLSCGTCHVYVDEEWLQHAAPVEQMEAEMLETVFSERKLNSRLSCQIMVTETSDNMRIVIPEKQY